ncbi:MAG: M28 family peptidase [Gemmatimonadota bacterium]
MTTLKLAVAVGTASACFVPTGVLAQAPASFGHPPHLERAFQAGISPDSIGERIRALTERPTFPGSPYSEVVAERTLDLFQAWGFDAHIERFVIPFPRAVERRVDLLGPAPFAAALHEPPLPGDPYSAQQDQHLETYFIYGPDGDVTAPVVYANFGLREDYDTLERLGVSVVGRIVLVRAGRMWRGGKVQLASERGAAAVLVFSDPRESGFFDAVPYPEGPGRTPDGVERGSILYGKYPGDPLTPFRPAVPGADRLSIDSADNTVARIPALPLSAADAEPFLAALDGPVVPPEWRGALPLTYRTGPSRSDAHLRVRYEWRDIEIRDVIATLPGSTWPDEWVVRGNHHDGWVYGAQDPHSGHAALLEEARMLGRLYQEGWRPKRTIVFASWDAEEQGVIGSTEWVEAHASHLAANAVAYLNTDVLGPGILGASGSSAWADFATEVAATVTDPASGLSLLERARLAGVESMLGGGAGNSVAYDADAERLRMLPPGYGSDHHSFVSHAGVATLNFGFSGGFSLGAYHTIYDNHAWYSRFGDPGFEYGAAAARLNGVALMRLADAELLPVRFTPLAVALREEVDGARRIYERLRARHEVARSPLGRSAVEAGVRLPVSATRSVPPLDFGMLERALTAVGVAAERYDATRARGSGPAGQERIARANAAVRQVERAFLRPGGLPGRPHYGNEFYSPGRLWDTVPVPALGDAMLDGDWTAATAQLPRVAETLTAIAEAIDQATAALGASR